MQKYDDESCGFSEKNIIEFVLPNLSSLWNFVGSIIKNENEVESSLQYCLMPIETETTILPPCQKRAANILVKDSPQWFCTFVISSHVQNKSVDYEHLQGKVSFSQKSLHLEENFNVPSLEKSLRTASLV